MQQKVPPQVMAQMLAAGPQGAPQGGPPPSVASGGPPPGPQGPAAGSPMDPAQAAQVLGQLGITPDNFMVIKQAMDAVVPLMSEAPSAGGPPAAGGGAPVAGC